MINWNARMIKKLTVEQERDLSLWHEKYFQIGASTEAVNKPELEKAITDFYRRINKKEPVYIHCDSPMTSMLMLTLVLPELVKKENLSSLRSSLESSLWSSLWSSLRSSLESSLWSSLRSTWIS